MRQNLVAATGKLLDVVPEGQGRAGKSGFMQRDQRRRPLIRGADRGEAAVTQGKARADPGKQIMRKDRAWASCRRKRLSVATPLAFSSTMERTSSCASFRVGRHGTWLKVSTPTRRFLVAALGLEGGDFVFRTGQIDGGGEQKVGAVGGEFAALRAARRDAHRDGTADGRRAALQAPDALETGTVPVETDFEAPILRIRSRHSRARTQRVSWSSAIANLPGVVGRSAEATPTLYRLSGIYGEVARVAATHYRT